MNKKKERAENDEFLLSNFMRKLIIRTVICVITSLLLLSLISNPLHPEDTHILDHGLGDHATVGNWIGLFGAYASRHLLLWFGFASYIGVSFIGICVINRMFNPKAKPANKIYVIGIATMIIGCSMLLGVFPNFLPSFASRLNISSIPGGVIGQRFCAPWTVGHAGGWLAYVVNPVGSMIIASGMMILGMIIVWRFDWHDKFIDWKKSFISRRKETASKKQSDKISKSRLRNERNYNTTIDSKSEKEMDSDPNHEQLVAGIPAEAEISETAADGLRNGLENNIKAKNSSYKYKLPTLDLLNKSPSSALSANPQEIETKKRILQDTLDSFSIDAEVGNTTSGPRVTLFEIKPAAGVKVERISSLANNIAMNLKAENLRILTPIPGKDTVGIEVPNRVSSTVALRDLLESSSWTKSSNILPLALGKTISGKAALLDLSKAPHLLIAGATGSGKSVCMNTIILSLLYRFSPDELKLIMVDPKVVEFSGFKLGITVIKM